MCIVQITELVKGGNTFYIWRRKRKGNWHYTDNPNEAHQYRNIKSAQKAARIHIKRHKWGIVGVLVGYERQRDERGLPQNRGTENQTHGASKQ